MIMQEPTRPCAHCGDAFVPQGRPYSHAATYCVPCGTAYRRAYNAGRVDEWHAERAVKCACGNTLPTGHGKYCSDACRASHKYKYEYKYGRVVPRLFTCDMPACHNLCIASHGSARYCSRACNQVMKVARRSGRPVSRSHPPHWVLSQPACGPTLAECDVMRQPVFGPTLTDWPIFGPERPRRIDGERTCRCCERRFVRTGRSASFRSERCQNMHRGLMESECPLEFATCPDAGCGEMYVFDARTNRPAGCCPSHTKRVKRRRRKRAARALKRGQVHEPYTLREIAERDGWRCHLCGGKVPDREYTAHDKDATIDHLIPQSLGGDDVKSNVALAHNRCNWERGNQGLAQLRLVG